MIDDERTYHLFLYANQKSEQENQLWGSRAAAFLTASSFLFVGAVALLVSEVTLILPIIVCLCGLALCFLQNRGSYAAREGADIYSAMKKELIDKMQSETSEFLTSMNEKTFEAWGASASKWKRMFLPRWIHEYWMPGVIAFIWTSALVVALVMTTSRGV